MKSYFVSFGAQTQDYHNAVRRICNQATKFGIFDKVIGFTETDLQNDPEFWTKHSNFVLSNSRGYGYWLWKPYIIKQTLETMNDGDILLYADSGCELNVNGKKKMLEFIELTKTKHIIATTAVSKDTNYTKRDLTIYMQMENDIQMLEMRHVAATVIMLVKNEISTKLVNEWYSICSSNYHFIDDSPSIANNFEGFIEHRHDQSVFSLLMKKANMLHYDLDPTYFSSEHDANELPILAIRNRTGVSII